MTSTLYCILQLRCDLFFALPAQRVQGENHSMTSIVILRHRYIAEPLRLSFSQYGLYPHICYFVLLLSRNLITD